MVQAATVTNIAAGYGHSLFIKSDGSLWGMGYNGYGQPGDGTLHDTNSPEQIISSGIIVLAAAGNQNQSLFIKSDGNLGVMGWNYWGELGDGFTNEYSSLPEQIHPLPRPLLKNNISFATNLQFNATCQLGGTFYLRASPNLNQAFSQWTLIATNVIHNRANNLFSATLANGVGGGGLVQNVYILRSQ